jgi:hypothetical protein
MTTKTKKYLLLSFLLICSNHTINCADSDLAKLIIELFFGKAQPSHPSAEEYVANLRHSLRGLPQSEINEIAERTRSTLQYADLSDSRTVNEAINGELVKYLRIKVTKDVNNCAKQRNINLDQRNRDTIINSYVNDFIKHIGTLSYIEGKDIQQYFGNNRTACVNQILTNATIGSSIPAMPAYNNQFAPQQTTSAPMPYTREYYAQQHAQFIEQILKEATRNNNSYTSTLTNTDIQRLKGFVIDSTNSVTYTPAENRLAHTKNGLAQLLDEKLEAAKRNLQSQVVFPYKLMQSIETTRQAKIADIEKLQQIDRSSIAALLGNNAEGKSNIEEDIIANMGITCPVCYELFKEEHCHGKVNKEVNNCGHEVCKGCMQGCNKKCPLCRAHA